MEYDKIFWQVNDVNVSDFNSTYENDYTYQ